MQFNFTFTEAEANLILQALGKLPAEMTMELILKLQTEAKKQIEASQQNPQQE